MSKLMRRVALLMVFLVAVTLAACGGAGSSPTGHTAPTTLARVVASTQSPSTAQIAQRCPKGESFMGCSVVPSSTGFIPPNFAASGCKIPDVSNWQGHPNWDAAKRSICGAIFKAGEYSTDPDAQYNATALARLHIWHAIYWFIRNTGCSHEAAQIIAAALAYHVTVVANDLEAPEASGYAGCLVPAEKKAGLTPVNYTAPGTWPGGAGKGNAPLWQAEYGPTLHPFWKPVVAWQCSDGHFGCVTTIPGIGQDDVSINMGITSLGGRSHPPAKPTDPYAALLKTKFSFGYGITADEYDTVKGWHTSNCANPVKQPTCETLHYHAQLLRDRLLWLAKHQGGWATDSRNTRYKALQVIVG